MTGFTLENLINLYFTLAKVNGDEWAISTIYNSFAPNYATPPLELTLLRVWVGDFPSDKTVQANTIEYLERIGYLVK